MTLTGMKLAVPILIASAFGIVGAFAGRPVDDSKDQEIPNIIDQLVAHPDRSILLRDLAAKKAEARKYFNLIAMQFSSPDAEVRRMLIITLIWIEMPVESAAPWTTALIRRDSDEDVRVAAAAVLEDLVCKQWNRDHPVTRVEIAGDRPIPLPKPQDDRAKLSRVMRESLDALVSTSIHDKSFNIRAAAASAAVAINPGEKRTIPALVEAATKKNSPNEKYCAISILRTLDPANKTVIESLCKDLSSTDNIERIIAIQDLQWLQATSAADRLQKLVNDPDEQVRDKAKRTLDFLKAVRNEKK